MTDHDLEQRLRAWYRAEMDEGESAPLQLRTELATLAQTAERSRRPRTVAWRFPMNRFAAAATAVAATLLIGFGLLSRPSPDIGPSPSPNQTHGATLEPSTTPVATPRAASWTRTANLLQARAEHTATLLPDGRVLVAGGVTGGDSAKALATAELFDPVSGTWIATAGLSQARIGHAATLLPDGKVLVVGGAKRETWFPRDLLASAELFDPATGTWTPTGSMSAARRDASALLLPDGTVLVVGGSDGSERNASPELYEPRTGTWTVTSSMIEDGYWGLTTTVVPDGRVLVVGNVLDSPGGVTSAQLYDPVHRTWAAAASMIEADCGPSGATVLRDGTVLVACGHAVGFRPPPLVAAELYDPSNGTWIPTGEMHGKAGGGGVTLTLLANGHVLAVVLESWDLPMFAEVFDPATGSWTPTMSKKVFSAGPSITVLNDGTVLFAGGGNGSAALADAELYDPGSGD